MSGQYKFLVKLDIFPRNRFMIRLYAMLDHKQSGVFLTALCVFILVNWKMIEGRNFNVQCSMPIFKIGLPNVSLVFYQFEIKNRQLFRWNEVRKWNGNEAICTKILHGDLHYNKTDYFWIPVLKIPVPRLMNTVMKKFIIV